MATLLASACRNSAGMNSAAKVCQLHKLRLDAGR